MWKKSSCSFLAGVIKKRHTEKPGRLKRAPRILHASESSRIQQWASFSLLQSETLNGSA